MEQTVPPTPGAPSAPDPGDVSLLARTVAIFVRPAQAWAGLERRAQWWFPLLLVVLITCLGSVLLYRRAQLPTMLEAMDDKVAAGEMTTEQLQKIEDFYGGPMGVGLIAGVGSLVSIVVITLLVAVVVWFGVGFVLGTPFRFRLALEVTAWSSLITIPPAILAMVLAWYKQNMRGVHIGFGLLLPEPDSPTRWLTGLGVFLDWIGPFGIWHLCVSILGAAALSRAPRKSVAWVLASLYVAGGLFTAVLASFGTRGA
jgi:hypothetical protein